MANQDESSRVEKLVHLAQEIEQKIEQKIDSGDRSDDFSEQKESSIDAILDASEQAELRRFEGTLNYLNRIGDHIECQGKLDSRKAANDSTKRPPDMPSDNMLRSRLASAKLPRRIGRFEIQGMLGQGGFARVFLAKDPNLGRLIALKVPKPSAMISEEARIRFDREACAAAALAHPNIASVFETGSAGPIHYIASHYCAGSTLGEWFETQDRRIDVRLAAKIVARLAEAVQHAHQRGVIHRDLKPGNILIEIDETLPRDPEFLVDTLRITDFGLAKVQQFEDQTLTTEGAIVGTPAYMSPEQARGEKEIGAATDIYSLGVILYQLLTGELPHLGDNHIATLGAVQNVTPTSPRKHCDSIPRDLDAICLKTLSKSPSDRYATAHDLATDLQRWLDGQTVFARHATSIEKLTRWTQRNPLLALVCGLVLITFAVGLTTTTWQWQLSQHNLKLSQNEYLRAETNLALANQAVEDEKAAREQAERIADFVGTTYRSPSPSLDGREVKIIDVLARSEKEVAVIFKDDPDTRWALMRQLGIAYSSLGLNDEAIHVLQAARDEQVAVNLPPNEDTPAILRNLSQAYHAKGDYDLSFDLADQALQIAIEHLGPVHRETIECYSNKATILQNQGDYESATRLLESTIQTMGGIEGFSDNKYWRITGQLGAVLLGQGKVQEALPILTEATANLESLFGEDHPNTLRVKSDYVHALINLKEYNNVLEIMRQLCESNARVMGPEHPQTIVTLNNLASVYNLTSQPYMAVSVYEDCVKKSLIAFGAESPNTGIPKQNLANVLVDLGQLDRATTLYEDASRIFRKTIGPLHRRTVKCNVSLARVYQSTGQWAKASERWEQLSIDHLDKDGGPSARSMSAASQSGICLIRAGDVEDGIGKVNAYFDFAPGSGEPENVWQKNTTRLYGHLVAALVASDQIETALPYAEIFRERAISPDAFQKESYELLSFVFLAAIYAELDRESEASEFITGFISGDAGYSLDDIEDPTENRWIRIGLTKLREAAARDDSILGEFESEIARILNGS